MLNYYCVGHRPPAFTPSADYIHISPTPFPGLDQLLIPEDALGAGFHGSVLSEYTQLFGLADHLRDAPPDDRFYMFQYRKFLSLDAGGLRASNAPYIHTCPAPEASHLFPSPDRMSSIPQDILVGPSGNVPSLAAQYCRHHLVEDFAAFVLSLRSVDGFDDRRCKSFISCDTLLPAPSLGLNRNGIFRRHMGILRSAWGHFAANFLVPREDYQRRVGGFLLERLHSFLIYEDIEAKRVTFRQAPQILISDSAVIEATI